MNADAGTRTQKVKNYSQTNKNVTAGQTIEPTNKPMDQPTDYHLIKRCTYSMIDKTNIDKKITIFKKDIPKYIN